MLRRCGCYTSGAGGAAGTGALSHDSLTMVDMTNDSGSGESRVEGCGTRGRVPLADVLRPAGTAGRARDALSYMADEDRRSAALARLQASRGKYKRAGALLGSARRAERNNEEPDQPRRR